MDTQSKGLFPRCLRCSRKGFYYFFICEVLTTILVLCFLYFFLLIFWSYWIHPDKFDDYEQLTDKKVLKFSTRSVYNLKEDRTTLIINSYYTSNSTESISNFRQKNVNQDTKMKNILLNIKDNALTNKETKKLLQKRLLYKKFLKTTGKFTAFTKMVTESNVQSTNKNVNFKASKITYKNIFKYIVQLFNKYFGNKTTLAISENPNRKSNLRPIGKDFYSKNAKMLSMLSTESSNVVDNNKFESLVPIKQINADNSQTTNASIVSSFNITATLGASAHDVSATQSYKPAIFMTNKAENDDEKIDNKNPIFITSNKSEYIDSKEAYKLFTPEVPYTNNLQALNNNISYFKKSAKTALTALNKSSNAFALLPTTERLINKNNSATISVMHPNVTVSKTVTLAKPTSTFNTKSLITEETTSKIDFPSTSDKLVVNNPETVAYLATFTTSDDGINTIINKSDAELFFSKELIISDQFRTKNSEAITAFTNFITDEHTNKNYLQTSSDNIFKTSATTATTLNQPTNTICNKKNTVLLPIEKQTTDSNFVSISAKDAKPILFSTTFITSNKPISIANDKENTELIVSEETVDKNDEKSLRSNVDIKSSESATVSKTDTASTEPMSTFGIKLFSIKEPTTISKTATALTEPMSIFGKVLFSIKEPASKTEFLSTGDKFNIKDLKMETFLTTIFENSTTEEPLKISTIPTFTTLTELPINKKAANKTGLEYTSYNLDSKNLITNITTVNILSTLNNFYFEDMQTTTVSTTLNKPRTPSVYVQNPKTSSSTSSFSTFTTSHKPTATVSNEKDTVSFTVKMNDLQFIPDRFDVKNLGSVSVSKTHATLTKPVSKLLSTDDPKRVTNLLTSSDDFNVKNFETLAFSAISITPNEPINSITDKTGSRFVTSRKLVMKNDLQFIRNSLNVKNSEPATVSKAITNLTKSSIVSTKLFTTEEPKSRNIFPFKTADFKTKNSKTVKHNEPEFRSNNLDAKNSESKTVSKIIATSTMLSTFSTELPNTETVIFSTTFTPSSDAIINEENTRMHLSEKLVNSSGSQSIRGRNISKISTTPITSTFFTELTSPPRIQVRTEQEQPEKQTVSEVAGFNFSTKNLAKNIKSLIPIPTFNNFYFENREITTVSKTGNESISTPKWKENSELTERAEEVNHLEFIGDSFEIISSGFATFTIPNKSTSTTNDEETLNNGEENPTNKNYLESVALEGLNETLETEIIRENTELPPTTLESTNINNTRSKISPKPRTIINTDSSTSFIALTKDSVGQAGTKLFVSKIMTVQSDVNNYNLKEIEVTTNEVNKIYQQKSPELLTIKINDSTFIRNTFNASSNESINLEATEDANRIIAIEETHNNLRSVSDIKNLETTTISSTLTTLTKQINTNSVDTKLIISKKPIFKKVLGSFTNGSDGNISDNIMNSTTFTTSVEPRSTKSSKAPVKVLTVGISNKTVPISASVFTTLKSFNNQDVAKFLVAEEMSKNTDLQSTNIDFVDNNKETPTISFFTTSNGSNATQFIAERFDVSSSKTTMPYVLTTNTLNNDEVIITEKLANNNDLQYINNTLHNDNLEAVTIPPSLITSNQLITTSNFEEENKLPISEESTYSNGLQSINKFEVSDLVTRIFFKTISTSNQSAAPVKTTNILNKGKSDNKIPNTLKPTSYNSMQLNRNSSDIANSISINFVSISKNFVGHSAITNNLKINNGLYSVSSNVDTNSFKPVRISTIPNVSTTKLYSKKHSKVSTSEKSMTSNDLQYDSYSFVTNNIRSATFKPTNILPLNDGEILTKTGVDSDISTIKTTPTNSRNSLNILVSTSLFEDSFGSKRFKATERFETDTKSDSELETIGELDKFLDYQAVISTVSDTGKNTHVNTDEEINNNRTTNIITENLDNRPATLTISDVEHNTTHVEGNEETNNNKTKETIVENANANYQNTAVSISDMENKITYHKDEKAINTKRSTETTAETPDYRTVIWTILDIENNNTDSKNNNRRKETIAENLDHRPSTTLNRSDVENKTSHNEHNKEINNKKTSETVAENSNYQSTILPISNMENYDTHYENNEEINNNKTTEAIINNPGYQAAAVPISDIENKNDHPNNKKAINNNKTTETAAETPDYQAVIWTILDTENNNTNGENDEKINNNRTNEAIAENLDHSSTTLNMSDVENKITHNEHNEKRNQMKTNVTVTEHPNYQTTILSISNMEIYNTPYENEDEINNNRTTKPVEENQDYQAVIWAISNIDNKNTYRENEEEIINNRPTEKTVTENLVQQVAAVNIPNMKTNNIHDGYDEQVNNNRTKGTMAKNPDYQTTRSTIFDMDNNNAHDENNQIKLQTTLKLETISIPFWIELKDIGISTDSSSTNLTGFYKRKNKESQINGNQITPNATGLEAPEIMNSFHSGLFNSTDNNKSKIETTTIGSITVEDYLTSLDSSSLNLQRNTPEQLTNFSENETGLSTQSFLINVSNQNQSKEIQNFVQNLVETTTAPGTISSSDLEQKPNNTAAESNILWFSSANTENVGTVTKNLDYSYNTGKYSEKLSNFETDPSLYHVNYIQTITSSENIEDYKQFTERLNMLMNNIQKNNIDSCNNFNQYSCKNQFNMEFKFEMFDKILKAVVQNGLKFERFEQFYESCSTYSGKTKIKMEDTINLKLKAIQDKLKSIISEMILSQTMYFFDIKVKIGKRRKFQFEFGLPEHNILDNWTMISKFRKTCVDDTDNNTGNAGTLDIFKDCVYNETMKYVMAYPHKGKQAEAEYNIAKITEILDLQKQYYLTDVSEEEFTVKDLYEQFDFGLSWKLLLQELSQATITNKTVVIFQNNIYLKKLFEKFQSLRKNSLKEVLYLWHRMHLDGYYFETVQDRKYYCVEKAIHLLPRETIQILNFISNDTTVMQNSVSPTEINNIFQDLKYTLKKFITQCRLKGVQSWMLQKRLKHLELYFSGNALNNPNFNHHVLLTKDFPNQVLEVVRSYKKDVYSLVNQKVTPSFLSNYFLNPLTTKPKSFFPINYIVYHPGYFLDIPKNLPPVVKLAVLGLPLSEEILKSFYYKDFLTRKLKCFFTSIKVNPNFNKTQTFTLHSWRKEKSYELLLDIYKNKPYLDNNGAMTNFSSDQLFLLSSMQTYCKEERSKSLLMNVDKQSETAQLLQDSSFFKNAFNC